MGISISIICIVIILLIVCFNFIYKILRYIKRLNYIKHISLYISVLDYHMDKAYDMIHKDRILAYSLDAYRVPDEDYETISQDYIRLVNKYIGPTLLREFLQLYGNEDSFLFILLEYFSKRYEEDEIRKTAMDGLTQEE